MVTGAPTTRTGTEPGTCHCSHTEEECQCATGRAQLARRAQQLYAAGWRNASSGDWDGALRSLRAAVTLDDSLARAWELLGHCAFARGAVAEARRAWRRASEADPASHARDRLQSLEAGELRDVVGLYNEAVKLAKSGSAADALSALSSIASLCPHFLPALRLEGLLRLHLGQQEAGSSSWLERAKFWSADSLLRQVLEETPSGRSDNLAGTLAGRQRIPVWWLGLAAAASLVGALWLARNGLHEATRRSTRDSRAYTGDANTVEADSFSKASSRTTDDEGWVRSLSIALSGDADSIAELLERTSTDTIHLSPGARSYVRSLLQRSGRNQYELARVALADGRRETARSALETAVRRAGGAYYADDALYLLMQLERERGDTSAARDVATHLLAAYPHSIFANSITRSIAATGR